jgi:hypothetical protein
MGQEKSTNKIWLFPPHPSERQPAKKDDTKWLPIQIMLIWSKSWVVELRKEE